MANKGKERLKKSIGQEVKSIQKQVLDYAELVIPNRELYSQFRRKVLDVTNDIRRNLEVDIDLNYSIDYDPKTQCEDVILVGKNRTTDYIRIRNRKDGKDKE